MIDIILDFDGTITTKDTISILGAFGISHQKQNQPDAAEDLASTWEWIVSEYVRDHSEHVGRYEPGEASRSTLEAEAEFLRSLAEVDARSLRRVRDSGIFKGVTEEHLFEAGRDAVRSGRILLRPGFADFASAMAKRGARLCVISVNWSTSFIRGVISQSGVECIDKVISNEVTRAGAITGPTPDHAVLTTSEDKLLPILKKGTYTPMAKDSPEYPRNIVYFGDSPTDLECLALAFVGIVITDDEKSSALFQTLLRLGYHITHVSEAEPKGEDAAARVKRLAWARNFREVLDTGFLDGLLPQPTASHLRLQLSS